MTVHSCILCIGSNFQREIQMPFARQRLCAHFPSIRFGEEMETIAIGEGVHSPFSNQVAVLETELSFEEIRSILKAIERESGRTPEDKAQGIVRLDIDMLTFDEGVLKPEDLQREYVQRGLKELSA